jgi:hypothetical protein
LLCTTSRLVRRDWQSEKTVVARTSRRPDQSCSATYSFFQCRNVYEENLGFSNVATACPFWHCLRLVDLESYADVWRYGTAIHPRFGPDAWRNCRGADRCPERERLVIRVVSPMRRLPAQPYRRVGRDQGPRTKEASDHCSLEKPCKVWRPLRSAGAWNGVPQTVRCTSRLHAQHPVLGRVGVPSSSLVGLPRVH